MGLAYILAPRSGKQKMLRPVDGCHQAGAGGMSGPLRFCRSSRLRCRRLLSCATILSRSAAKTSRSVSLKRALAASDTGESWVPGWLPPPLAHRKPEMRSLMGPFFFLFQSGLARPSDFRRLAFRPKLVSEGPASLSIRPSSKSRRIQKVTFFQCIGEIVLRRS